MSVLVLFDDNIKDYHNGKVLLEALRDKRLKQLDDIIIPMINCRINELSSATRELYDIYLPGMLLREVTAELRQNNDVFKNCEEEAAQTKE